jgi:hypothetical protein
MTDIRGDSPATINWACLSFFLTIIISHGFDSTTISPMINVVNIRKYASDLQIYLAVKQIEKEVETHDTCLQSLVKSHSLNQTKLSYKIDNGLKTIATNITWP